MMENIRYIFIKTSEVTQGMVNRSLSRTVQTLPVYTVSTDWWLFTTSEQFYVLEFRLEDIYGSSIFDSYEWFDLESARVKLLSFDQSQV